MPSPRSASSIAGLTLAVLLALAAGQDAKAQGTDPADLAYWQSVQSSTDPAEYQAYLEAFPNGRFVQLARARLARLQAGGAGGGSGTPVTIPGMTTPGVGTPGVGTPGPGTPGTTASTRPPPAPVPAPTPDPPADEVAEKITVTPASPRVGQIITFGCIDFPDPTGYDKIVVVPAGTPELDPTRNPEETKVLGSDYARNCKESGTWKAGPFAPGRYEVRFVTQLYNNDHRYEVRTRASFSIR